MTNNKKFVPALKFHCLTGFFDFLMSLTGLEEKLKDALLVQANIKNSDTVLDFGCGTGTLTIMAKKEFPEANIHGIDIDSGILKIAKNKVKNSGHEIFLKEYDGISLPYKDGAFDKVLSTLVFHHLIRERKIAILMEIYRILKPGGELHIADLGKGKSIFMKGISLFIRFFDGFSNTFDNVKGLLPLVIEEAGFNKVVDHGQIDTLVGSISFYSAIKCVLP